MMQIPPFGFLKRMRPTTFFTQVSTFLFFMVLPTI